MTSLPSQTIVPTATVFGLVTEGTPAEVESEAVVTHPLWRISESPVPHWRRPVAADQ
jgi:hypothetical protein